MLGFIYYDDNYLFCWVIDPTWELQKILIT